MALLDIANAFLDPEKIWMNEVIEISQKDVRFCWDHVHDAESYTIIVRDDLQKTTLANIAIPENISSYPVAMSEDFRVGQTCLVKVEAFIGESKICESDWKNFFIGKKYDNAIGQTLIYNKTFQGMINAPGM